MKISILCSNPKHPINSYLEEWMKERRPAHDIQLLRSANELFGGEILFLVSCTEIVTLATMRKYKHSLVLHASDLPYGRGWSPHIWDIVAGRETISLCLLEAAEKVDTGKIWKKVQIAVPKHALWSEVNELLFKSEVDLLDFAISECDSIEPQHQLSIREANHHRRRTPLDSRIDPNISIADQFDLIRVCDPDRFPVFFEYLGFKYLLKVEKSNEL